jgi:pyruvate dehydrogenase E1 component
MLGDSISKWLPSPLKTLGTFGFGRSESRASLRDFFEVDAKHIVYATLYSLVQEGSLKKEVLTKAIKDLGINPEKLNPLKS